MTRQPKFTKQQISAAYKAWRAFPNWDGRGSLEGHNKKAMLASLNAAAAVKVRAKKPTKRSES